MTRWRALIVGALIASGCGGSSTSPSVPGNSNNLSSAASSYLNEVTGLMQTNSINRARINWTDFRSQVFQRAQGAQTIADTYLTTSVMADRTQAPYGDTIAPDEAVGGDAPVVDRAIAWLRNPAI